MTALHSKSETSKMCQRIRPFHIYAYRDQEALCAISEDDEDVEWVDIESIDDDCHSQNTTEAEDGYEDLPRIHDKDLNKWIGSPWVNEN